MVYVPKSFPSSYAVNARCLLQVSVIAKPTASVWCLCWRSRLVFTVTTIFLLWQPNGRACPSCPQSALYWNTPACRRGRTLPAASWWVQSALLPMHRSMPKRDHKWPSLYLCSKSLKDSRTVSSHIVSVLQSAVDGTLYLIPRAVLIVVEKL